MKNDALVGAAYGDQSRFEVRLAVQIDVHLAQSSVAHCALHREVARLRIVAEQRLVVYALDSHLELARVSVEVIQADLMH